MSRYRTPLKESIEIDSLDIAKSQVAQNTQSSRRHSAKVSDVNNPDVAGGINASLNTSGGLPIQNMPLMPHMLELDSPKIDITDMNAPTAMMAVSGPNGRGIMIEKANRRIMTAVSAGHLSTVDYIYINRLWANEILEFIKWNDSKSFGKRYAHLGKTSDGTVEVERGLVYFMGGIYQRGSEAFDDPYSVHTRRSVVFTRHYEYPLYNIPSFPAINRENHNSFLSLSEHTDEVQVLRMPIRGETTTTVDISDIIGDRTVKAISLICLSTYVNHYKTRADVEYLGGLYGHEIDPVSFDYIPNFKYEIEATCSNNQLQIINRNTQATGISVSFYLE